MGLGFLPAETGSVNDWYLCNSIYPAHTAELFQRPVYWVWCCVLTGCELKESLTLHSVSLPSSLLRFHTSEIQVIRPEFYFPSLLLLTLLLLLLLINSITTANNSSNNNNIDAYDYVRFVYFMCKLHILKCFLQKYVIYNQRNMKYTFSLVIYVFYPSNMQSTCNHKPGHNSNNNNNNRAKRASCVTLNYCMNRET